MYAKLFHRARVDESSTVNKFNSNICIMFKVNRNVQIIISIGIYIFWELLITRQIFYGRFNHFSCISLNSYYLFLKDYETIMNFVKYANFSYSAYVSVISQILVLSNHIFCSWSKCMFVSITENHNRAQINKVN